MVWAILGAQQSKAMREILGSGSERIIAVVGGTMLDETLRNTLEDSFFRIAGKA
ncbi:MAG: hypothetical protein HQ512_07425 [Rhodospirillales bacterium]|nr:hypothetical protein [Rhodospirillales bacterium]